MPSDTLRLFRLGHEVEKAEGTLTSKTTVCIKIASFHNGNAFFRDFFLVPSSRNSTRRRSRDLSIPHPRNSFAEIGPDRRHCPSGRIVLYPRGGTLGSRTTLGKKALLPLAKVSIPARL